MYLQQHKELLPLPPEPPQLFPIALLLLCTECHWQNSASDLLNMCRTYALLGLLWGGGAGNPSPSVGAWALLHGVMGRSWLWVEHFCDRNICFPQGTCAIKSQWRKIHYRFPGWTKNWAHKQWSTCARREAVMQSSPGCSSPPNIWGSRQGESS